MITLNKHLEIKSKYFMVIIDHINSNGGHARLIGGVVRDSLLGIISSDIDIATDLIPDQVIKVLTSANIKVIPTGIKYGTVTAVIDNESFQITTLRKDIDCDGRYASVEYSDNFAEDAARRDFTINALSYCPINKKIYDYFGGLRDLKEKKIVFIGNAGKRVQEDYLRILRFFRFSARFAKDLDSVGLNVCIKYKEYLKELSKERIKSEMDSILLGANSPRMLKTMSDTRILSEILPAEGYDMEIHLQALLMCKKFKVSPTLALIYSILFMYTENISFSNLIALKFSKACANVIMKMRSLTGLQENQELLNALKHIWLEEESFVQYFVFATLFAKDRQCIYNLYLKLVDKEMPVFPITGNDILALGYQGKAIGRILGYLKEEWVKNDFKAKKSFLLNVVLENEK